MSPVRSLTSRQNPRVAAVCALRKNPSADAFLLEGQKFVCDAEASIRELYTSTPDKYRPLIDRLSARDIPVFAVSQPVAEKLCVTGTDLLAVVSAQECPLPQRLVLLDDLQDPGNVGTILRTALAFDYGCILSPGCANPYSSKVIQSSAGAVLSVPLRREDPKTALRFCPPNWTKPPKHPRNIPTARLLPSSSETRETEFLPFFPHRRTVRSTFPSATPTL